MSHDETTKIEPTLIVKDAPPIAGEQGDLVGPFKPEAAAAATIEVPVAAAAPETPKIEEPKIEEPKIEPAKFEPSASQAPLLPPAPQLDPIVAPKQVEPVIAQATSPSRSTRFALLAACVAIAASFGAVGGSLGVAKFGPMISSAPPAVAPIAKEQVADEVKALKESVAQLRTATRTLSENFSALKTSVTTAGTQNAKIAETLERIEKGQAEQRKMAAAAPAHTVSTTQSFAPQAAETTGSIGQKQTAAPMVLGDPPTMLKQPTVPGWVLRRVYDGAALIEGRDGIVEVEPGMITPGLGRVEAIKRQDGRWVVVTSRGLIVGR